MKFAHRALLVPAHSAAGVNVFGRGWAGWDFHQPKRNARNREARACDEVGNLMLIW